MTDEELVLIRGAVDAAVTRAMCQLFDPLLALVQNLVDHLNAEGITLTPEDEQLLAQLAAIQRRDGFITANAFAAIGYMERTTAWRKLSALEARGFIASAPAKPSPRRTGKRPVKRSGKWRLSQRAMQVRTLKR